MQGENDPREFASLLKKFDPLHVRALTCRSCTLGQSSVAAISEMTSLQTLDLAMCVISKDVLVAIVSLCLSGIGGKQDPRLPVNLISLREVSTVDDSLFSTLSTRGTCNTCTTINVSSTSIVYLSAIAKVFPKLQKLRARFLKEVKAIKEVIGMLPLTELSLEGIENPDTLDGVAKAIQNKQRDDRAPPIEVRARGCHMDKRNIDLITINTKKVKVTHDFLGFGETDAVERVDKVRVVFCISGKKGIEVVLRNVISTMPIRRIAEEAIEELNAMCSQEVRKRLPVASKARRQNYADALSEFMGTPDRYVLGVYGAYYVCKESGREKRADDTNIETAFIGLNNSHSRLLIRVEAELRR